MILHDLFFKKNLHENINAKLVDPDWSEQTMANTAIGPVKLIATSSGEMLRITVLKDQKRIGNFDFLIRDDHLEGYDATVLPHFQQKGISKVVYPWAEKLGNRVIPGENQTPAGQAMWNSFRKMGLIKPLKEDKDEVDLPDLMRKFLPIAIDVLDLPYLPKINLEKRLEAHHGQATFGRFVNHEKSIYLAIADRHPVDILRTLAHELTHWKQFLNGELGHDSGKTGSPEENQAHAKAGIIMRIFDKKYPNTLKLKPVLLKSV